MIKNVLMKLFETLFKSKLTIFARILLRVTFRIPYSFFNETQNICHECGDANGCSHSMHWYL